MAATAPPARSATLEDYSDEQLRALQTSLASTYIENGKLGLPEIDLYTARLLDDLGSHLRIYITAKKSSAVNAAAYWGKIIVLNAGMFDFVRNEEELLGILAHEVAHIAEQHFVRMAKKQKQTDALAGTALLLGVLSGNSELAKAVISGSLGLRANLNIATIRAFEYEADSIAFEMLVRAGVDPAEYAKMMRRFDTAATDTHEYLQTHPLPHKRLAQLRARLRQGKFSTSLRPVRDFLLARELVRFQKRKRKEPPLPDTPAGRAAASYTELLYGGSDAAAAAKHLMQYRDNWLVALALGKHLLRGGETGAARKILAGALNSDPSNWVLASRLLEIYTNSADFERGRELLTQVSPAVAGHFQFAFAEAKFWSTAGKQLNYRLALTRAYYLGGRLHEAQQQSAIARLQAEQAGDTLAVAGLDHIDKKILRLNTLITKTLY